ncbi:MAG TPA: hypothetical protein V6C57_23900, partial [Coleofasciculaceae cyanobacterium]
MTLQQYTQAAGRIGILLLLILNLWLSPAIAQSTIAIDGRSLFQVSDSGQYTAEERASLVTLQLKEAVQSGNRISVRIEQRNQLPTLVLNNRYLLTVTQADVIPGSTPDEQADIWAQQIQAAVKQAQVERSAAYFQEMTLLAGGIVLAVALLHWLSGKFKQRVLRSLRQRLPSATETPDSSRPLEGLLQLLLSIARLGIWIIAALYVTNLFPVTRSWSYQITHVLVSSFTSPIITLGRNAYSITNLLLLAGVLAGLVALAGTTTNVMRSRILHLAGLSRGGQEIIAILTKY